MINSDVRWLIWRARTWRVSLKFKQTDNKAILISFTSNPSITLMPIQKNFVINNNRSASSLASRELNVRKSQFQPFWPIIATQNTAKLALQTVQFKMRIAT